MESVFTPRGSLIILCADVVVVNKDKIAPHIHSIPTSSKPRLKARIAIPGHDYNSAIPYRLNLHFFPRIEAIFFITFFVTGFTTLKRRSAKGFASSSASRRNGSNSAVVTTVPIGTALITC